MFHFFHILSFGRCSCSCCSVLLVTKVEECQCCQEIDRCAKIMAEIDHEGQCITLHPGFRDVCLNKYVLEVASLGLKLNLANVTRRCWPKEIEVKPSKFCTFFTKRLVNVMWDSAASLCFITNNKAKAETLKGKKVELSIIELGGRTERLQSHRYRIPLIDLDGNKVHFDDKITNEVQNVDVGYIAKLFTNVSTKDIVRSTGEIEVLIGYQYATHNPQREQNIGHLLLLKNQFGK